MTQTKMTKKQIKRIRRELGMTQAEFAREVADVSVTTVARWEIGMCSPSKMAVANITRVLEASPLANSLLSNGSLLSNQPV